MRHKAPRPGRGRVCGRLANVRFPAPAIKCVVHMPGVGFGLLPLFLKNTDHAKRGSYCCQVLGRVYWHHQCMRCGVCRETWIGATLGGKGVSTLKSSPGTGELISTIACPLRGDFLSLENYDGGSPSPSAPGIPYKRHPGLGSLNTFEAVTKPVCSLAGRSRLK